MGLRKEKVLAKAGRPSLKATLKAKYRPAKKKVSPVWVTLATTMCTGTKQRDHMVSYLDERGVSTRVYYTGRNRWKIKAGSWVNL